MVCGGGLAHLQSGGDIGHRLVDHADHAIKRVLEGVVVIVEIDKPLRSFVRQVRVVQLWCWVGARLGDEAIFFLFACDRVPHY